MAATDPPPIANTLWSDSHIASPYRRDEFLTEYRQTDGILQVPVAGVAGTGAELIRLHGGCMRKVVRFEQNRAGDIPEIPTLQSVDPSNEVRAGYVLAPQAPQVDANGSQVFAQVSGELTFYLVAALTSEDGYRMAAPPHTTINAALSKISTPNFKSTIL